MAAQVFTREAVVMIHERSGGIPRTINVLADNALLAAFALGHRPVGTSVVTEVARDFDLSAAANADVTPPEMTAVIGRAPDKPAPILALDSGRNPEPDEETPDREPMFGSAQPKRRLFSFFSK